MGEAWFHHDEEKRRKWQDPEAILREVGLKEGMIFVDVGSGPGFFALPASEMVGEGGRVYAIDSDPRSVKRLANRASEGGLKNIVLKVAGAEETVLFEGKADVVFYGIDLHDFSEPARVLQNAMRMLKQGGRLVDLDWRKEEMAFGPPLWKRFSEEKAARLISEAGFRIVSVARSGRHHYLIIAVKP